MPHINRIRVNNVKYNFGTQFYDDFILRMDGKNTLYDLANGGGKSVLMLLLFQNMIPNCTLDDKQPIEKLFRTDQGSKTIHSLIEWKLDKRFMRDNYKYMLTGFCARKAREELREAAAIEYFNYVIFYREYNDNDIVNLPLTNGGERVTYSGLKAYLRDLGKKDLGLDVYIFERKGEYQQFISRYGLYESQWEILRGINKTEGHVRTYFETRYRTTRKVVEDLLIEEIIQRAAFRDDDQNKDMADILVQIKGKLAELTARKKEIGCYDRQSEILRQFSENIEWLLKSYEEKEAADTDIIKTYNSVIAAAKKCEKERAVFEKERDYAGKHIYEISRKLDTARIQENQEQLNRLENDTEAYRCALEKKKEELIRKQDKLAFTESMNDYNRYLDVRMQWVALKEFLAQNGRDAGGMLEELQKLAGWKHLLDQKNKEQIEQKTSEVVKTFEEKATVRKEADRIERELMREEAVLLNKTKEISEHQESLSVRWNALCRQVSILIPENVTAALNEKRKCFNENEAVCAEIEETIRKRMEEKNDCLHLIQEKSSEREKIEEECGKLLSYFKQYESEKEKWEKLKDIYHVGEKETLEAVIHGQLRKLILDLELKRREIRTLERQLKSLQDDTPAETSAAVTEVMEYIRRCHDIKCVYGGDYLFDVDEYDRKILLERFPFLPEAVIIEEGMKEIKADSVLVKKNFGDTVIPVVALNQILSQEEVVSTEHILFLSNDPALYTDADIRKEACETIVRKMDEARTLLERLSDREKTVEEDQYYVQTYKLRYQQYYDENTRRYEELQQQSAAAFKALENAEKRLAAIEEECGRFEADHAGRIEKGKKIDAEVHTLLEMKEVSDELLKIGKEKEIAEDRLYKNRSEHDQVIERLDTLQNTIETLENQKKNLRENRARIEEMWQTVYLPYYSEDVDGTEIDEMDEAALEARFKGLKEAYEKEHSDLEDKKRLLESYWQMMETAQNMIRKRGTDLNLLEQMNQEHRLEKTEEARICEMEKEITEMANSIQEQEKILSQYSADKNKLFGSVAHGVSAIEEKYGVFEKVAFNGNDYSEYVKRQQKLLEDVRNKQQEALRNIQSAEQEIRHFEDIKRDLERWIREENILFNRTKDTYAPEMDLFKKYRELSERYLRLRSEIRRKQEGYEREKNNAVEELRKIAAVELADSIRTEVGTPETVEDSKYLIDQLKETVGIIALEKDRIEKTIQDMVQIKANFEKQCLQRCVSIRAELERFPAYSRILLDGQQVPMVMLKIPYVREELYDQRMSEYIDSVVAGADSYDTEEAQAEYIRKQLSWKRIFSVIVTDMNSIRLSLYKRERVKEQSRYLKYEEAVGSTGQSQGIYIQFLIGVINYISMVYSGSGDGTDLMKVIFIDNPFGAAKDIYIWQPIFELLQKNRVQLIVPTRGATPAITGKFDVNYILGQKMIDQVQQTVIVDYSSNIDIETMSYEKLEFEQEVFDFI